MFKLPVLLMDPFCIEGSHVLLIIHRNMRSQPFLQEVHEFYGKHDLFSIQVLLQIMQFIRE